MSSPNATLSDIEDDQLSNDKNDANNSDAEVKDEEKVEDNKDNKDSEKKKEPRTVQNPQPKLDAERLKSAKGIHAIEEHFADFKFRGKGYEKADLDVVMKKLEYWSHRLFPKFEFDASLSKFETLGTKKAVQTHLKRIRLGLWTKDDIEGNSRDVIEDDDIMQQEDSAPIDEFDALIAEQLEKQRQASTTPQRGINNVSFSSLASKETPRKSFDEIARGSGYSRSAEQTVEITDEMKEKMEMNRQLAMKKRLARIEAEEAKKKEIDSQIEEQNLNKDKENNVEMIIDDSNEIRERIERNRQLAIKKRLARIEAEEAKKRKIETQDKEENQTVDNDNENNVETMLEESIIKN